MNNDWRNDPATEKQKEKLRFFGCTWNEGITKGQANDALDECVRRFPKINEDYYNRPATEEQMAKIRTYLADTPDEIEESYTYGEAKDLIWNWEMQERQEEIEKEDTYWKSEAGLKEQEWSRLNTYWPGAVREVTPDEFDHVWALVKSRKSGQPTPSDLVDAVMELFPEFRPKPTKPGVLNYCCYHCRSEIEIHFSKTNKTISYTGRDGSEIQIATIDETLTLKEFLKITIQCPHCGRDTTLCPA